MSQPAPPHLSHPGKPKTRRSPVGGPLGVVLVLGVLGIGASILFVVMNAGSSSSGEASGENGALGACETFVKQELQSPSTAVFSGAAAEGKTPEWVVHGAVDSMKSVGATMRTSRSYYECPVRRVGDDTWQPAGPVRVGDAPYRR
ncbi:hypothetical protein [Aeromicrobium yanjiei]|uniref:Uncharacterized protein n=1 Tax=Aeromicrobium yanjiei TaxID=2662028 RepID=A0A5Q2MJ51_9ACTN|nr:hypothetical protein [Aeromicrobium yanjiei]QGG41743.1 hypothetical protein GEV26_10435 [Aeromicrobium yanjiei]